MRPFFFVVVVVFASSSVARAQDRIVVLDETPSARAEALRVELAGQPVVIEVVAPGANAEETARALLRGGATAVAWQEGDPARVRVLRSDVREAPLTSSDDRAFAIVTGSLLREGPSPEPVRPAAPPELSAHLIPAAPRDTELAPAMRAPPATPRSSGLDPLYLSVGVRLAFGPVVSTHPSSAGDLELEGRVGVSFGDYGIALVARAGGALLASALDYYESSPPNPIGTVSGAYFGASGYLALLGTGRFRGFFARGAYFALGAAYIFGKPGPAAAFSHPILWISDTAYIAADVTAQAQIVSSCATSSPPYCNYAYLHLQFGLSLVLDD